MFFFFVVFVFFQAEDGIRDLVRSRGLGDVYKRQPYDKMGKSPCGFAWDTTGGAFGPFTGQIFVGDQHHAAIFRVSLEQVGGLSLIHL